MPKKLTFRIEKVVGEDNPDGIVNGIAQFKTLEGHLSAQASLHNIATIEFSGKGYINMDGDAGGEEFTLYLNDVEN